MAQSDSHVCCGHSEQTITTNSVTNRCTSTKRGSKMTSCDGG